jgi:Cofactor assembly of complex C subunit B, CCB2/CCB4
MERVILFPLLLPTWFLLLLLLSESPNALGFPSPIVTTSAVRSVGFSRPVSASSSTSSSTTRLYLEQQPNQPQQQKYEPLAPGTARFSRIESSQGTTSADGLTNTLDWALSVFSSDIVSIVLGAIGLAVVVGHRMVTTFAISSEDSAAVLVNTQALAQQTRTDLLAVFACGSVLLNGITKMDVVSALGESVVLQGVLLDPPELDAAVLGGRNENVSSRRTVVWALESLLSATPAQSAVILQQQTDLGTWTTIAKAGILPPPSSPPSGSISSSSSVPASTPILDRVGSRDRNPNGKETYLPTLQNLPGRLEFTYLPPNTQLVLIVPLPSQTSVLVLGSNTAKSFSPRDVAWVRVVAELVDRQMKTER